MFLFKKLIGPLLLPQSVCLVLLLVGLILLWFSRRQKLAKSITTLGVFLVLVTSYPVLWSGLVSRMEWRHPPLKVEASHLEDVRWVVVLGGGAEQSAKLPATSQLANTSLMRLIEGIRIQKALPKAKLLVAGSVAFTGDSEASVMKNAAEILGVASDRIVEESRSRDTEEQAVEVKRLIQTDRFILVTSALHMTRAMALFQKQGLSPIPAPTDFFEKGSPWGLTPDKIFPLGSGPAQAEFLMREYLGLAWAKMRNRA